MNENEPAVQCEDKALVRVLTMEEAEQEDRTFWHSKTPAERLVAAEALRQAIYAYDPVAARIQAIAELAQLKRG